MNTFQIIARLWYFVQTPRHPLIRYEMRRAPRWERYGRPFRRVYRRLIQLSGLVLFVGVLMEIGSASRVSFLVFMLTVLLPLFGIAIISGGILAVFLWQIPIALVGSSGVINEKTAQTWDLMRVTPIPRADLLLAKLAVGLARLQTFITVCAILQFLPLLALLGQVTDRTRGQGTASTVAAIATIGLFVIIRLQEFIMAGLLGVAASLLAENWPLATVGAIALGAIVYLTRVIMTYALAVAIAGGRILDAGPILMVGIPILIGQGRNPAIGFALIVGLIVVQELLIRLLLRWMVRRMAR